MLHASPPQAGENALATPNYAYEKRQRELAKKRKQEEKRQKKIERKDDDAPGTPQEPANDGTPAPPAQDSSAT